MPGKHPSREMIHLLREEQWMFPWTLAQLFKFFPITYSEKPVNYKLGEGAVRWVGHWLNCQAQRVVVSGTVLLEASH